MVATTAPNRRLLVAILLGVIPLSQFPIDVYSPAIPTMVRELGTTSTLVQNSVSAYVLGMAIGLLPVGVIADARGRKPTLLVCLALLVVASIGIAFTNDIAVLLALRFAQGLGGCACMVVVYAIAADTSRGPQLTSLSGWLGASWGLAPVIAPAIGGILVQFVSWRGIFVLVAVLGVVAGLVVWRLLPETLAPAAATPVRPRVIAGVLASAFRRKLFVGLTLVFAVFASAQLLFGVVAPLLYETGLGVPPAAYGLIALLVGAANLGGELATGALATRISSRTLGFSALAAFAAGTAVLLVSGLTVGPDLVLITLGGMFVMLGCGALCPLAYGLALGLFDRNLGLIGGLTSAVCYLFVAITMGAAASLPDDTQTPIGFVYVGCLVVGAALLALCLQPAKTKRSIAASSHSS
ncbi:Bcr/CflA family efflux MFS transporter [Herbiconiux moechotypicola]|uniref:Multidrug effflux MFS transporter n=1 Tax=Herbiconiux moechotypicola TaxID=637393 RepID=A0ABP5QZR1_9MICO|nr:Bcr/CflA family efflux MFS transporter [Herbiconiux moechotypicola]MCS5731648.1 Bcr/CflA family efflux MFS transporter [Herbiconiux moechotypicola]